MTLHLESTALMVKTSLTESILLKLKDMTNVCDFISTCTSSLRFSLYGEARKIHQPLVTV